MSEDKDKISDEQGKSNPSYEVPNPRRLTASEAPGQSDEIKIIEELFNESTTHHEMTNTVNKKMYPNLSDHEKSYRIAEDPGSDTRQHKPSDHEPVQTGQISLDPTHQVQGSLQTDANSQSGGLPNEQRQQPQSHNRQNADLNVHYRLCDRLPSYTTVYPHNTAMVMIHQPMRPATGSALNYTQVPIRILCQHCHARVTTIVSKEPSILQWTVAILICLFGGWFGCCLIPFYLNSWKDVIHTCPNCDTVVGKFSHDF